MHRLRTPVGFDKIVGNDFEQRTMYMVVQVSREATDGRSDSYAMLTPKGRGAGTMSRDGQVSREAWMPGVTVPSNPERSGRIIPSKVFNSSRKHQLRLFCKQFDHF